MESLSTFITLFLLSVFTFDIPSSIADVITDRDGDAIGNGGTYHILPLFGVKGGGIELSKTGNETCPLTVAQSPYRIAYISEGLILNLAFASSPSSSSCGPTPATWTVVKDLPEGWAVKLPGYGSTVSGWFKIEKSHELEYLYKVVFCARVGNTCGDIRISVDDQGNSRLVVTHDQGIIVEFMKAS